MNVFKIEFEGIFRKQTLFIVKHEIPTVKEAEDFIKSYGFERTKIYNIENINYWRKGEN